MTANPEGERSSATLRAARSGALQEERTRETVLAAAKGIAERTGVALLAIDATPDVVKVTVEGSGIVAMGLLAELRRTTEQWYATRQQEPLWSSGSEESESGS